MTAISLHSIFLSSSMLVKFVLQCRLKLAVWQGYLRYHCPCLQVAAAGGTVVETLTDPHSWHRSQRNQIPAEQQRTQSSERRKEHASPACVEGTMPPESGELHISRQKTKTSSFFPTLNCHWLGQRLMLLILFLKGRKLLGELLRYLLAQPSPIIYVQPRVCGMFTLGCGYEVPLFLIANPIHLCRCWRWFHNLAAARHSHTVTRGGGACDIAILWPHPR